MKFIYGTLSGGYQRLYEILKRGKHEGIDYIIVIDSETCRNALKIFPDFMELLKSYKVIKLDLESKSSSQFFPNKQLAMFKRIIKSAVLLSKVAREEKADLLINPEEGTERVFATYLASILCSKPWTAILQPTTDLLQPSLSIGPLNALNIVAHINSKDSVKNLRLFSKIGLGIEVLFFLKIAERTTVLAVSTSSVEDFGAMNPRLKFVTISPGNGVNLSDFTSEIQDDLSYQCVFFGRLVREKGIFDLIEIWKTVVTSFPNAKLVVCGILENANISKEFLNEICKNNLQGNIIFVGNQPRDKLLNIIRHSFLTINPSYVDSFSLVTIESLALGTPVVAYNTPAISHNFGKCKAVFRCLTRDKKCMAEVVLRLFLRKKERRDLGDVAKRFASSYDWSNVVKSERKAYLEVIERT